MRLWSIHPKYLDTKGLLALWREALLAKAVLAGKTKGYSNHPQLIRFKQSSDPQLFINTYLKEIYEESMRRGYNFDDTKLGAQFCKGVLSVTDGQIVFERAHLLKKLKARDVEKFHEVSKTGQLTAHPLFQIIKGPVENWEVV